ncbi:MAG TPA: DUF1467 family protein [Hellea balneolensis]|uniref:DUF1467 family protein n=1 Tax=Hellea balneolensis TaxID=287478 RepID=A0A7V5U117_9PROT|nr:DUF1467 family protein [Hellea balneolensis]
MPSSNDIVTAIAVYFLLWWICIFLVLPFGVRGQHEDGDIREGTEPGAPVLPRLKRKFLQTSILAALIWIAGFLVLHFHIITLETFSFLPDFTPPKK